MANNTLFYIFIGISLVLIWGYFYGKRKNNKIAHLALNTLIDLTNPEDQKITNIGGLVGYHIELIFDQTSPFEHIKGTLTLLPRQSLLYLPFSLLIRKFDRFFITIKLHNNIMTNQSHIFAEKFMYRHRKNILTDKTVQLEKFIWEGHDFCYCYQNEADLQKLKQLKNKLKNPDKLKEISIHPDSKISEILLIPTIAKNEEILLPLKNWILANS